VRKFCAEDLISQRILYGSFLLSHNVVHFSELHPKVDKFNARSASSMLGNHIFFFNRVTSCFQAFPLLNMTTTLLHLASGVEAAVEAYISVQDFADELEWRKMFVLEMVSAHLHSISIAPHLNLESHISFVSPLTS
jgi:hypothetical protein